MQSAQAISQVGTWFLVAILDLQYPKKLSPEQIDQRMLPPEPRQLMPPAAGLITNR